MLRSKISRMEPIVDQLTGLTGRRYKVLPALKPNQDGKRNISFAE